MLTESDEDLEPEPRWHAVVALLAVGGLYTALPESLSVGPQWLLICLVSILLVPTILSHRSGLHRLNYLLGHLLSGLVTLFVVFSIGRLVQALPSHAEAPITLLRSAASLWFTNVLVFASWYWRLDAGGPHKRDQREGHPTGAFLFPQMTLNHAEKDHSNEKGDAWTPNFVDYLFLAFNTSTALSPTDAPVLSRWAKILVMTQATISLTIIVILAARAINIL